MKYLRKELFVKIVQKILFRLEKLQDNHKKILDIGCGSSDFFSQHANLSVYGLDIDYKALKDSINQKILLGNVSQVPFSDNSFDGAIAILFFHSITRSDQKTVLTEMKRIIKGGSKMVILDFCLPESMVGKITGRLLALEEMLCGHKHYQNYVGYIKGGGLEELLRLSELDYKIIKKYRFGNLVLVEAVFDK